MFSEYDPVKIKFSGIRGIIVDIANIRGEIIYTIEGDAKIPAEDGNGETWPLYQCKENEIEKA